MTPGKQSKKNLAEASGWKPDFKANQKATATLIYGKTCRLGGWLLYNRHSATVFLQIFDKSAANQVTVGTTTPLLVMAIPAGQAGHVEFENGIDMDNGIVIAATTTATGSGAPTDGMDTTILYR